MCRTAIVLWAVTATALMLIPPWVPLGIPGEWVWPRQALPANLLEALDRFLPALLAGSILLLFSRFVDVRIAQSSRRFQLLCISLLACVSYGWLVAVLQSAPTPHRELRPLWVLYDKSMSGYFFEAAFHTESGTKLLSSYEARMARGDVLHEGTHPPGLFLLNWWAIQATRHSAVLASVSEWTQSAASKTFFRQVELEAHLQQPLPRPEFAAMCLVSFLSTVAAAATVIPVFGLVRRLTDPRTAWQAATFCIPVAGTAVFIPRSDTVYSCTATLILWMMIAALRETTSTRRLIFSVLAGTVAFLSLLISLVHLPVIATGFGVLLFSLSGPDRVSPRRVWICAALMGFMFLLLCATFVLVTGCHIFRVWLWNLSNHAGFYEQFTRTYWKWLIANPLEMAMTAGLPLALAGSLGLWKAVRVFTAFRAAEGANRGEDLSDFGVLRFAGSATVIWTVLWLSGKNMGESARLWCFMTPWCALLAAFALQTETRSQVGESKAGSASERDLVGYRSAFTSPWLQLLLAQLIVCTLTVARVSGYLELSFSN